MSTAQRLAPWPEQLGALSVFPRGAPSELGKAAARRAVVFAIASYDQSAAASFCIRLPLGSASSVRREIGGRAQVDITFNAPRLFLVLSYIGGVAAPVPQRRKPRGGDLATAVCSSPLL